MAEAGPGAVALIETPDSFVLEGRPDFSGALAYAGKVQFFGGHIDPLEEPRDAIRRELREELNWEPAEPPTQIWEGCYDNSRNRHGERVTRHVTLFRATVDSIAELNMQVPGYLIELPKTREAIEEYKANLTEFTYKALRRAVGLDGE